MLTVRRSADRGYADHGWLQSYHTFSFAGYQDPQHMGFRQLRVINQDWIAGGKGFGKHSHRDMEIVTYMVAGALKHEDSLGNQAVIHAGEVQRMSAGTGIVHSEFNHDPQLPAQLLQIWIHPDREGLTPSYEQKFFGKTDKTNIFCLLVSPDGRNGSIKIHQDAEIYASILSEGTSLSYPFSSQRFVWIQVISGRLLINDREVSAGDGLAVGEIPELLISAQETAEILLFDLP